MQRKSRHDYIAGILGHSLKLKKADHEMWDVVTRANDHVARFVERKDAELYIAAPELLRALKLLHKHFITEAMSGIGEYEEKLENISMKAISQAKGK